ncbi:hypothetical protein ACP3P6_15125 [Enterobacter mori]
MVFLIPANMLPISIIYVNGARQEDTILSGLSPSPTATWAWRPLCLSPVSCAVHQSGGDVYVTYQHPF